MKNRRIWLIVSLLVTLCTIGLLAQGSSLLTTAIGNSSIPSGTFITWAGIIALPLSIYLGVGELRNPTWKLNSLLSGLLKIILILAILWVPISYLLAGNLSFTFKEKETFQGGQTAMKWFWRLSYGIGIGSIATLLLFWILSLFRRN